MCLVKAEISDTVELWFKVFNAPLCICIIQLQYLFCTVPFLLCAFVSYTLYLFAALCCFSVCSSSASSYGAADSTDPSYRLCGQNAGKQ